MHRLRAPFLLSFALLASTTALAAGAPEQRATSETVSGAYFITFNLNLASTLPAGTTITCRARIVPNPGSLNTINPQIAATPVETAAGLATINGSTANCAAEIPFSWTVSSAQGGVVLSYEIEAVVNSGGAPLAIRSSAQQAIAEAFPSAGGTANLSFNVTF